MERLGIRTTNFYGDKIMNSMDKEHNIKEVDFNKFFLMAGNCIVEDQETTLHTAVKLKEICADLDIQLIYKSSFYKANRTSLESYTGPDTEVVRRAFSWVHDMGLPIISDIHTDLDVDVYGDWIDIFQIPAFLCRQTDLLLKAGATDKPVMIKKGQFIDPHMMKYAVEKVRAAQTPIPTGFVLPNNILLCERGTMLGYNDLVVDMRSLKIMQRFAPVVFDATHSVQNPGGKTTGGGRQFIPTLARAAIAAGIDGLFMETHPDPSRALSDAATQYPLDNMRELLEELLEIRAVAWREM